LFVKISSANITIKGYRLISYPNRSVAYSVVTGSSPPLAYCTIFIVMSSEVVDLHIFICIRTSHCLYLCTNRLQVAYFPELGVRGVVCAVGDTTDEDR